MEIKLRLMLLALALSLYSLKAYSLPQEETNKATQENMASAIQIMNSIESTYKNCTSYSDTGLVRTVYFNGNKKRISEIPFSTDFIRQNKFRFEFSSKQPFFFAQLDKTIIVKNENSVRYWRNHNLGDEKMGVHKAKSLSLALAGATGISGGSANTIPALLGIKDLRGWKNTLTKYHQISRMEDALLNETPYYRIKAQYQYKNNKRETKLRTIIIWVNKSTYLVHRIDSQVQFPKFRTEETTTYNPSVDINIENSRFTVNP